VKQQRLEDFKLTQKQARFVAEYAKDWNATQAAIRAGYAAGSAEKNAYRLMEIDGVKQAIRASRQAFYESQLMTAQEAHAIKAQIIRVGQRDFFDAEGNALPVTAWTPAMSLAVAGVEVILKNAQAGDGVIDKVLKLKFWDKTRLLDMINKINGS
jgi:phage terminase small subunit